MTALIKYDDAKRALAQVRTATQAKDIRDKALALQTYAKQAMDAGLECMAAEIKVRSERKLGEILIETEKNAGAAQRGRASRPRLPTLQDLGISKDMSASAQRLAKLPESRFESYIKDCLQHQQPPRSAELLSHGGRGGKMRVHHSSKNAEHYTPAEVIELVQACFDGEIDLDPCSNSKTKPNVPARKIYTKSDDGLYRLWSGNVFVNPPYGDELPSWVDKCIMEHQRGRTNAIILLVPSRTDTQWWRKLRDFPVCFWSGRLTFVGNDDPAPFASALFWLSRQSPDKFAATFAEHGDTYIRFQAGSA